MARCDLPVLVTGESGVGKERTARAVHDRSPRATAPFVSVNCAALTESLLEAELFGATRGAYTGADRERRGLFGEADGGTLFLDEIGEMPVAVQAKLLRALDGNGIRAVGATREVAVDVRIVAATHRDLAREVERERFRADLYYRLAVLVVRVPALRDRRAEFAKLARAMLARVEGETRRPGLELTPAGLRRLEAHDWPGNMRELHAVLARAALRASGRRIDAGDLELPEVTEAAAPRTRSLEASMVERALLESRGSISAAALRIGWTRQKLYRRIAALGLEQRLPPRRAARAQDREPGSRSSDSSTFQ